MAKPRAGVVVQKYGGTSVATAEHISAIADRVASRVGEGGELIIVLSAMGKTTDELVALAHQVSRRPGGREMDLLLSTGEQVSVSLLGLASGPGRPGDLAHGQSVWDPHRQRLQHREDPIDRHQAHPG